MNSEQIHSHTHTHALSNTSFVNQNKTLLQGRQKRTIKSERREKESRTKEEGGKRGNFLKNKNISYETAEWFCEIKRCMLYTHDSQADM